MKKAKKTTPSDLQAADNIEDLKEKSLTTTNGMFRHTKIHVFYSVCGSMFFDKMVGFENIVHSVCLLMDSRIDHFA